MFAKRKLQARKARLLVFEYLNADPSITISAISLSLLVGLPLKSTQKALDGLVAVGRVRRVEAMQNSPNGRKVIYHYKLASVAPYRLSYTFDAS